MYIAVEQWQFECIGWALTPGMIFFTLNTLPSIFLHRIHRIYGATGLCTGTLGSRSSRTRASVHRFSPSLAISVRISLSLKPTSYLGTLLLSTLGFFFLFDKPDHLDEAVDATSQDILGHPYRVAECSISGRDACIR